MLFAAMAIAYALGCLSPGWWLARRRMGIDLRTTGSGGTGATNAARVLGRGTFVIVLVLDAAKAALAIVLARLVAGGDPWHVLALPSVVAGHIWPAPLGFRGGRGAAPLLGGCVAMNPWFAIVAAAGAAGAALFTRRRLALTLSAAAAAVIAAAWLLPGVPPRVAFVTAVLLVVLAHRSHFVRAWREPVP